MGVTLPLLSFPHYNLPVLLFIGTFIYLYCVIFGDYGFSLFYTYILSTNFHTSQFYLSQTILLKETPIINTFYVISFTFS